MPKQLGVPDGPAASEACSPLTSEPISAEPSVRFAAVFRALGDPVRLRLLSIITSWDAGAVCVCELVGGFEQAGPTISYHLKVLRTTGLIVGERRGSCIYYRARPELLATLSCFLMSRRTGELT